MIDANNLQEKFLQMLTIPARVWMVVMVMKTREKPKDEETEKASSIEPISDEEDTASELQKLVRYLETGTVEQASERPMEQDTPHKDDIAPENKGACEKDLDEEGEPKDTAVKAVEGNRPAERTPGALKRIAKKKQKKKEKRRMSNKKPKEAHPASNDAIDDVSDAANSEPVALTNASIRTTDSASFTSAPPSPPSSSCLPGLLQSSEHQAPAVYESPRSHPVPLASNSRLTTISVDQAQSEGKQPSSSTHYHPYLTTLLMDHPEPAADIKSCPGPQEGGHKAQILPVPSGKESRSAG